VSAQHAPKRGRYVISFTLAELNGLRALASEGAAGLLADAAAARAYIGANSQVAAARRAMEKLDIAKATGSALS
jgi:hypothetical protein